MDFWLSPDTNKLTTIVLAVIAIFFAIKFAKKIFKFIAICLILLIAAGYLYFSTNMFEKSKGNLKDKYSIVHIQDTYCSGSISEKKKIKCECILEPVLGDLKTRFSDAELEQMRTDRSKLVKEIFRSFLNKRDEINTKLKQKNSENLLDEFKVELRNGEFFRELE